MRTRTSVPRPPGALIDVGLWQMPDTIVRRVDALAGEELAAYRSHPRLSAETLRRWGAPDERIVQAVLEHHEREQGQGFPQGLTGATIDPDAKIVGLADLYAGLTVPSTARPRLRPHEAVREIVKSRHEAFPTALVKALLSEISVFPPGTIGRLNTEEIGRVVAVNRNHPLRPRVEIMADGKGQRLPAPKTIEVGTSAAGRTRFLKFDGMFHGLTEPWLFRRDDPTGDDPTVVPSSAGVPRKTTLPSSPVYVG